MPLSEIYSKYPHPKQGLTNFLELDLSYTPNTIVMIRADCEKMHFLETSVFAHEIVENQPRIEIQQVALNNQVYFLFVFSPADYLGYRVTIRDFCGDLREIIKTNVYFERDAVRNPELFGESFKRVIERTSAEIEQYKKSKGLHL